VAVKGFADRDLLELENTMKLITRHELSKYPTNTLRSLFRKTFDQLIKSALESHERRNALASLENIQREIASRDHSL